MTSAMHTFCTSHSPFLHILHVYTNTRAAMYRNNTHTCYIPSSRQPTLFSQICVCSVPWHTSCAVESSLDSACDPSTCAELLTAASSGGGPLLNAAYIHGRTRTQFQLHYNYWYIHVHVCYNIWATHMLTCIYLMTTLLDSESRLCPPQFESWPFDPLLTVQYGLIYRWQWEQRSKSVWWMNYTILTTLSSMCRSWLNR